MKRMLAFFDWLAGHKGVPVLFGVGLIVVNFLVVVFAGDGWAARTNLFLHIGLVVALFGELLADVL
jgi:hypothetical protein